MPPLIEKNGSILMGGLSLAELSGEFGTPLFAYDLNTAGEMFHSLSRFITWKPLEIYYAMKSNWNPDLLRYFRSLGSGIDAVSPGDILMAKSAGFNPDQILYTTNNITDEEMDMAMNEGVRFNVGSISRLRKYASRYPGTSICVRFNPDVVAGEHDYLCTGGSLSKFGVLLEDAREVLAITRDAGIRITGLHEHTGSGIAAAESVYQSMKNLLSIAGQFPDLEFIDFGGGFKVPYDPDEIKIDYTEFGRNITAIFEEFCRSYGRRLTLCFEPGKYLTAACGVLIVEVNTIRDNKSRRIVGVNSGLPHLIRPSFYGAYHHIVNLTNPSATPFKYDIVGNICESGDVFARDRMLPEVREGDLLAIQNAGSYCYSMGSIYNLRPLPAEVVIQGNTAKLSTKRLSFAELVLRLSES
ncbi:MAG: diaminopimelate decarboxylase [Candidatus Wallbacteria bacterium]|nr:diaminopimelate decarboxylase [Candidatus Wallbacteria bacterium]